MNAIPNAATCASRLGAAAVFGISTPCGRGSASHSGFAGVRVFEPRLWRGDSSALRGSRTVRNRCLERLVNVFEREVGGRSEAPPAYH